MLSAIFVAALVAAPVPPVQEPAPDNRGWAIRCAVTAHYAIENTTRYLRTATENSHAVGMAGYERDLVRLNALYQAALAAPYDVAEGAERFGLARVFREDALGMDELQIEDVLAACEVALARP